MNWNDGVGNGRDGWGRWWWEGRRAWGGGELAESVRGGWWAGAAREHPGNRGAEEVCPVVDCVVGSGGGRWNWVPGAEVETGEGNGAVDDDEAWQDPQHADGGGVDAAGCGVLSGGGEAGDEGEAELAEGEQALTGVARGFTGYGGPWPGCQARDLSGTGEEHGCSALDGVGGVGIREELAGEGVLAGDGIC